MGLTVGILGALEVRRDGAAVPVPGRRAQLLLRLLAAAEGRAVSASALIAEIWGQEDMRDLANALQSLVSRVRGMLGDAGAILQEGAGYRLIADLDSFRFADLVEDDPEAALRLWRGVPHLGLDSRPVSTATSEASSAIVGRVRIVSVAIMRPPPPSRSSAARHRP